MPDVIYKDENFIMGIEHFEFDSSKRNRKGSSLRKEESIIDSKIRDSIQNNEITESNNKIGFDVNTPLTFQYYVYSLIYAFRQHSSHAIGYKEALKQLYPNKTIILCFFIDDVTAIGNYIKRDNKLIPLFPSRIPLFLNELLSHPEIEYVVSRFEEFYIPNLYFLKNTPDNLLYEMKNTIKLNDTFFSYNYRIETNVHHTNKK